VWNHWSSHTQHLGRALIRRVAKSKGDLEAVVRECIDECPKGWSSFSSGERGEPDVPDFFTGTFDGIVASCDEGRTVPDDDYDEDLSDLVFDTHYLYLFHVPKRRLYVFAVDHGQMRPFGIVTFDSSGNAKPSKLPPVDE